MSIDSPYMSSIDDGLENMSPYALPEDWYVDRERSSIMPSSVVDTLMCVYADL